MKTSVFTFCLLLMTSLMMSQYRVALHSNGNVSIYGGATAFADAYNDAVDGDTIYLPGGNLTYPGTIDKSLTIMGVGHYPAATAATDKTFLQGNLHIGENADGLHIEGIYLYGSLTFNDNAKVDNVVIKRNRLRGISYNGDRTTPCENNMIMECVIDGNIYADNTLNLIVTNNIIADRFHNGFNTGVINNIFSRAYHYNYYFINGTTDSSFTNNIFPFSPNLLRYSVNNSFSYNVFNGNPGQGSNTFTNNYNEIDMTTLFQTTPSNVFDYDQDYTLQPSAQTNYPGFDGEQVGIYGGTFPFKTNSVPVNPTITSRAVSPETDDNGEINVQFTVEAQTN